MRLIPIFETYTRKNRIFQLSSFETWKIDSFVKIEIFFAGMDFKYGFETQKLKQETAFWKY